MTTHAINPHHVEEFTTAAADSADVLDPADTDHWGVWTARRSWT